MDSKQELFDAACQALEGMSRRFTRPAETKLTLVIRCPWLRDGDVVVSDDTPKGVRSALDRHLPVAPPPAGADTPQGQGGPGTDG